MKIPIPPRVSTPMLMGVLVWRDVLLGLQKGRPAASFLLSNWCVGRNLNQLVQKNCHSLGLINWVQRFKVSLLGGREILRSGSNKSFSMSFKIWKIIAHLGFFVQYSTKTNEDLLCCTWTRTTCEISGRDYPMHLALKEIQISSLWMEILEFHVTTACVSILDSSALLGETWYYIPYPCTMKGLCLGQSCSILPTYMQIKNLTTPTDMKVRNKKKQNTHWKQQTFPARIF